MPPDHPSPFDADGGACIESKSHRSASPHLRVAGTGPGRSMTRKSQRASARPLSHLIRPSAATRSRRTRTSRTTKSSPPWVTMRPWKTPSSLRCAPSGRPRRSRRYSASPSQTALSPSGSSSARTTGTSPRRKNPSSIGPNSGRLRETRNRPRQKPRTRYTRTMRPKSTPSNQPDRENALFSESAVIRLGGSCWSENGKLGG